MRYVVFNSVAQRHTRPPVPWPAPFCLYLALQLLLPCLAPHPLPLPFLSLCSFLLSSYLLPSFLPPSPPSFHFRPFPLFHDPFPSLTDISLSFFLSPTSSLLLSLFSFSPFFPSHFLLSLPLSMLPFPSFIPSHDLLSILLPNLSFPSLSPFLPLALSLSPFLPPLPLSTTLLLLPEGNLTDK